MRPILAVALVVVLLVSFAAVVGTRDTGATEGEPWTLAAAMSQRRSYVAAAELNGLIYAVGGMVGETGRFLSATQRFDPEANTWSGLPPLPEPVRAAAGAALDGQVYVIGGQTQDRDGREVYALDVGTETWEERAPLPEPRFNMAAVTLGGKVYALGGYSGTEERAEVFVYDAAADSWSEAASLPAANHTFGAVVFDDEILTIGGRRGEEILDEVWIYDPAADRWRAGPPLPEPMELVATAAAGEEIHAVWESTYQIYDSRTGEWRPGPRPLITRHGAKAFAVAGSLYTIGGCTTDLHDTQVVERRGLS
jgi:hypothetical protein